MAVIGRAQAAGSALPSVVGRVLLPAQVELERRHRQGEVDGATYAAGTSILRRALARAAVVDTSRGSAPGADVGVAAVAARPRVVVTAPGSDHLLGAEAIGEVLAAAGWPVDLLGVRVAAEDLAHLLASRGVLATIVCCSDPVGLPEAARSIDTAHRAGVPALAVGPAFGPDARRARRLGADVWVPDLDDVIAVLERWQDTPADVASPGGLPPVYLHYEQAREAIESRAAEAIGGSSSGVPAEWARTVTRALIDHLGAAVLVDDAGIVSAFLGTAVDGIRRMGVLEVHLMGLVDAVGQAIGTDQPRPTALLAESQEHLRRAVAKSARPLRAVATSPAAGNPTNPEGVSQANGSRSASAAPAGGQGGQAFADLLLLAALSCQTPVAILSVPQGDGQWSALSYGFDRRDGLNDRALYDVIAAQREPVEVTDLAVSLPRSPLCSAPHGMRWAYGAALRNSSGGVIGVVVVLDRWLRQLSRREQRAMQAVGRQLGAQLLQLRRAPAAPAPSLPVEATRPHASASNGSVIGMRRGASLPEGQQLLRSHEVAVLFDVTERTVINWAAAGKLPSLRTIGGHLRFRSEDVLELLAGRTTGSAS
jgi:excisionase family DNA binding protein